MPTYPTYKLSEIARSTKGKKPKSVSKEKTDGFEIPYVDIKAFEKGIVDNYTDGENCTFCKPDDVLIVWDGARCGFVGRGVEGAIGSTLAKISSDKYTNDFLFYFLQSKYKVLNSNPRGVGIPHIEPNLLWNFEIPEVDKTTQRAIVSRIETLFAELDKAVQHLRTAQQQLKTYRQAVLNHWLNNDDGKWEMVKLGNIADVNTGSTPKRGNKDYWENGNIPWITSGETNNPYITKATEFITTKAIAETNCKIIAKGSLVIAMYGEGKTRGKCAELSIDATTNQALASITFTDSRMYKNFAKWFFEKNYEDMRMLSSGGVQPNLNLGIIKNMILPLPPLSEQQRIVKEIESRLSQATASETYIENALQQAEALRQSILKKAFSGELV